MNLKKQISLIMIYLVVSLIFTYPVLSTIETVSIKGSDGVDGFRRTEDITDVDITATMPVFIKGKSGYVPMNCVNNGTKYNCHHVFDITTLISGYQTLTFNDNIANTNNDFVSRFIVDGKKPFVEDFNIETAGEYLILKVKSSDFADDTLISGSGVKRVGLTTDEVVLMDEELNESEINFDEIINVSGKNLEGNITFYMTLEDSVGNYVTGETTKYVDFKKPIISNNLKILSGDVLIDTISLTPEFSAVVSLKFDVDELKIKEAYVDAREITRNPNYAGDVNEVGSGSYARLNAGCVRNDVKYTCTVNGLDLNPGKETINIPVTVIDEFNNSATKILQYTFEIAEVQSRVVRLDPPREQCIQVGSSRENNFDCYVKRGVNVFNVELNEGDAEIVPSLITLYTADISVIDRVHPIRCEENDYNYLECVSYVTVSDGNEGETKRIVLTNPSNDLSGIPLTGVLSSDVILDFTAPSDRSTLNYTQVIADERQNVSCATAGETGRFSVRVYDETSPSLRIKAYTSDVSGTETFEKNCVSEGEGIFLCDLDISNFKNDYISSDIKVEIIDLAGNIKELIYENFEVCWLDKTFPPEVIKSLNVNKNDLSGIDLFVSSVIPLKVYIPFSIEKSKSEVEVLALDHDNCINTEFGGGGSTYYLNEFNADDGTPILVTEIGGYKSEYKDGNKIPVNCTVKIYVREGNVRYSLPEVENLNVDFKGYDFPMGTITDSVQDKLD
ncbi:MAG: hypothetical protein AB7V16_14300, partial [Vulcanibacillus sp.]